MLSVAWAAATAIPGVVAAAPNVPGPPPGRSTDVCAGTASTTACLVGGSEITAPTEFAPMRTDHTMVPGTGEPTAEPGPNSTRRTGPLTMRTTRKARKRPTTRPP